MLNAIEEGFQVKRLKQKIKNCRGFSLAETLMAILIMLLVASVIAAGIPAAANAYRNAIDGANAQTLLSTTVNALRSELSTAWGVTIDGNTIFYYSSKTGALTKLYIDPAENTIKVQDYLNEDHTVKADPTSGEPLIAARDLVSGPNREMIRRSAGGENKYYKLTFQGASAADGFVSFAKVSVMKDTDEIASLNSFAVRQLDPDFMYPHA